MMQIAVTKARVGVKTTLLKHGEESPYAIKFTRKPPEVLKSVDLWGRTCLIKLRQARDIRAESGRFDLLIGVQKTRPIDSDKVPVCRIVIQDE